MLVSQVSWGAISAAVLLAASISASPISYLEARTTTDQQPSFYGAGSQGNSPTYSVKGKHGAVSSEVDVCSNIGAQLLQEGGSAVDSIIGTALCVGSIATYHSGLGGGGHALLRSPVTSDANTNYKRSNQNDAKSNSASYIHVDFREVAPAASTEDMYSNNSNSSLYGGLAVGVPGEPKAWWDLHQKYGRLPWSRVFEPAILLNREGFKVTTELSKAINITQYPFLCTEELWKEVYCANGKPAELGQTIKKERFANTLEILAKHGIHPFYYGDIAADIVNTIQNNKVYKGIMTRDDLANYQVQFRQPRNVTLRGGKYKLYGTVAPSSGSVVLSTLETVDQFRADGQENLKDVNVSTHRLIEANRFSYGERTNYGDPAFVKNVSRLEGEYLELAFSKEKKAKINDTRTFPMAYYIPNNKDTQVLTDHGTSAITVVDADGMAISLTTTINTFWGSTLMTAHGFPLNNEQNDFSVADQSNFFGYLPTPANYIRPGKRPLSSISAVIAENAQTGELKLSLSSAGGSRIITAVTQVAYHVLFEGKDAQAALAEPRWHDQLSPNQTTVESPAAQVPGFVGFDNGTAAFLQSVGHNVSWVAIGSSTAQAVQRFDDGELLAATEVRQLAAKGAAF
ncbi:related to gamma-glutamyltransferase [Melanopsichium pennsylvanicum]|uniref:Glutathione hydrolase n=2 Tax=Melanopsichium pennsylvanicum TaxID=63383 RepID=A0AAJ5C677_9BASI|nr:related to gamma-glutamyltransferase [Melanopsichium pennsylvanicum 4]SNX85530.1 related to gamma-glutamyltransferase [Melanopsichium pennsylvanicum]